jgi:hypothetical protein
MKGNDDNVMKKMGENFQCHFHAKGMVGDIRVVKIDMTRPFYVKCHVGAHFDLLVAFIKIDTQKKKITQATLVTCGDQKWIWLPLHC